MNSIAFLFDMDGVLVDSNPYHKIALREFCKKHGHDLSEEKLREKIYGRTNKDWIYLVSFPRSSSKPLPMRKKACSAKFIKHM
jgi:beta-phosphoglucomutase-like phosphatase (HAD superfamily)